MSFLHKAAFMMPSSKFSMKWLLSKLWDGTGVEIPTITFLSNSSSDVGQTVDFDVKMSSGGFSSKECLFGAGGGNSGSVMVVQGVNIIRFSDAIWAITGLNLYDGEFHHFKLEKTGNTLSTLTVDSFTSVQAEINTSFDKDISYLFSGATSGGFNSGKCIIKNFIAINAASTKTHDMNIDDGDGATAIKNTGTTADGVIHGVEDTEYEWVSGE